MYGMVCRQVWKKVPAGHEWMRDLHADALFFFFSLMQTYIYVCYAPQYMHWNWPPASWHTRIAAATVRTVYCFLLDTYYFAHIHLALEIASVLSSLGPCPDMHAGRVSCLILYM